VWLRDELFGLTIRIKRAYLPAEAGDGWRVLIDRVWPRGVRKEEAKIDAWLREIAPSTQLRQWFGHDPKRWDGFRQRYRAELATPEASAILEDLRRRGRKHPLTLVFAAKDEAHSNAAALRAFLTEGD
jgi:uncharacterized protein YeaO (DUF488 family)